MVLFRRLVGYSLVFYSSFFFFFAFSIFFFILCEGEGFDGASKYIFIFLLLSIVLCYFMPGTMRLIVICRESFESLFY